MSSFVLSYPSGGPYTATWSPSTDPKVSDSQINDDAGLLGDLMADGATQYLYKIVPTFGRYTFSFARLTMTDRTSFLTFIDTVGGLAFDLTSGTCGPITTPTPVKFTSNSIIEWQLAPGSRFDARLEFVDA